MRGIRVYVMGSKQKEWVLQNPRPLEDYCMCCGAYLMGGATIHRQDCDIRKLIEETFKIRLPAED